MKIIYCYANKKEGGLLMDGWVDCGSSFGAYCASDTRFDLNLRFKSGLGIRGSSHPAQTNKKEPKGLGSFLLARGVGFGPTTNRLTVDGSTTELPPNGKFTCVLSQKYA